MLPQGFVAVHVGAGFHASNNESRLRAACKTACLEAVLTLRAGKNASLACVAAIRVLEDDPVTNAGFGSALNRNGRVECDAGFMDGATGMFGGIGAAPRKSICMPCIASCVLIEVKNPITVAHHLANAQIGSDHILVPPMYEFTSFTDISVL